MKPMALGFLRNIPLHEVISVPSTLSLGVLPTVQAHLRPRVNWGLLSGNILRRKQCLGGFLWQAWASMGFLERLPALWLELWRLRVRTFVSMASGMESQKSVLEIPVR